MHGCFKVRFRSLVIREISPGLQDFCFLEHYAGDGVMSQEVVAEHGNGVAKLDLRFHRSMDILSPSGFARLVCVINNLQAMHEWCTV